MYTINIDALADKKTLEQSLEEFRRAPMQVVDSPKQVVVSTETHKQVLARERKEFLSQLTEYVKKVDAMHLVDNSEASGEELLLSLTQNGSITAAEYIQIKANLQN